LKMELRGCAGGAAHWNVSRIFRLISRSHIDPCIYLTPGLIIFVYDVDAFVIAAESEHKLNQSCFRSV
jgi:hypothetical protein